MALESRRLHFGPTALRHRQSDARGARICAQGERRGKEEEGKLAPMGRFQGDGGNELSFPRRFSSPREAFSLGSRHYARPVQQLALKLLSRGCGAAEGAWPGCSPHPVPICPHPFTAPCLWPCGRRAQRAAVPSDLAAAERPLERARCFPSSVPPLGHRSARGWRGESHVSSHWGLSRAVSSAPRGFPSVEVPGAVRAPSRWPGSCAVLSCVLLSVSHFPG